MLPHFVVGVQVVAFTFFLQTSQEDFVLLAHWAISNPVPIDASPTKAIRKSAMICEAEKLRLVSIHRQSVFACLLYKIHKRILVLRPGQYEKRPG